MSSVRQLLNTSGGAPTDQKPLCSTTVADHIGPAPRIERSMNRVEKVPLTVMPALLRTESAESL